VVPLQPNTHPHRDLLQTIRASLMTPKHSQMERDREKHVCMHAPEVGLSGPRPRV
jgi:hypothetical protein